MANVKVRSGIVRNAVGVALGGKPAQLRNATTLVPIGAPVNTDPDGRYTFSDLPEEIRYQVEVAFGGGSNQVHVNSPISPDIDDLYVNTSMRTAAGATVTFNGSVSFMAGVQALGASSMLGTLVVGGAASPIAEVTIKGQASSNADLALIEGDTNNGWVVGVVIGDDRFAVTRFVSPSTYTERLSISAAGAVTIPGTLNVTNVVTLANWAYIGALEVTTSGLFGQADVTGALTVGGNTTLNNVTTVNLGGNLMARVWMNGANSQFASYALETYIANRILMGGTQAATSVTGVVRAFAVRDGAGNVLGWTPIYGAVN